MKEVNLSLEDRGRVLRDAMASTIDKSKTINLQKKDDNIIVGFGNFFDYIGYGYVGVKLRKSANNNIMIDINPKYLYIFNHRQLEN